MAPCPPPLPSREFVLAAVAGGVAAGIVSTLVQIVLWLLFTDAFPDILWRDARLAAAVLLGPRALPPAAAPAWLVLAAATVLHFGLSIAYGIVFCALTRQLAGPATAAAGALLGLALYLVNLHGFTLWLPWFAASRGWITLAAHVAFGLTATLGCRRLCRGRGGTPPPRPRS